ncbi:ATP-binding protein [Actinomadura rupiterrae]|uniref:ATP-binding protein n=1 Tax=Actinomadura rupiterrae TaxID=559627 RepID=UPI0020A373C7|nr:LuxR family transcriptional regulator [Actinomadura rupiterrae]MCP2336405.1 putative ATPase [Actinomadura rupiterrae]
MASLQGRPGNLPAESTSFVGRRAELDQVLGALERARLVTLLGPGGVGKTRLALRAADRARPLFPDGVWLVELSGLRAPESLPCVIAETLRLPGRRLGDPAEFLAERLAARELLLILDTCEHLVHATALLAERLLTAAPGLRVLTTSRESLNVVGEHIVPVPPLEVPGPRDGTGAGGGPDTGAACDSVTLFAERAVASSPGFAVAPANHAAVCQLCRRLEGIPLALELAAVRLRAMPVEEIVERLSDRFRVLGGATASRTTEHRHQTLRTAITWSHDLCLPAERMLWARLSVFPGDFDLAAAEAVCTDDDLPPNELVDVLTMLVDKSVVRFDPKADRYQMLDTLREYGAERLVQAGERDLLRRRHRDHYAALAGHAARDRLGPRQLWWTRRLQNEAGNLRAALEWSLETPAERAAGLRLAVSLLDHWFLTSRIGEARTWYQQALAATPRELPERGRALYAAGMFTLLQGDLGAAAELLDAAVAFAEASGDPDLRAHAVQELGRLRLHSGDLPGALELYREARAHYEEAGYSDVAAITVHTDIASVHALRGEVAEALELCARCLAICDARGESWCRAVAVWMRGATRWLAGETGPALADVRASLPVRAAFDDLGGIALALDLLMACAVADGGHERAAVLAGASGRLWETLGMHALRGPHYAGLREEGIASIVRALGEARTRELITRGRSLQLPEALAFAMDDPPQDWPGPNPS